MEKSLDMGEINDAGRDKKSCYHVPWLKKENYRIGTQNFALFYLVFLHILIDFSQKQDYNNYKLSSI